MDHPLAKDTYKIKLRNITKWDILLFCIAPLFIFNPDIAIIDIIPDFIGYILLLIPLSKLRDVDENFEEAKNRFIAALFISVGKYAALLLSFGSIGQNEGGSGSSLMMFSLVFATLDIIFVTRAFLSFFTALDRCGERASAFSVIGSKTKIKNGKTYRSKKTYTDKIKISTVVFIVAKALCYAVPEFSTSSSHGYDETKFDWSKFTSLFRVFGVAVALVFGVIWLVGAISYFARIFKDKELIAFLDSEYKLAGEDHKTRFILRDCSTFGLAMSIVAFLAADVYIGEQKLNILSDMIPAAAMLITFIMLGRLFKSNKKLSKLFPISLCAWLATSCAKDVMRYIFFSKYTMNAYEKSPAAYSLYTAFEAVSVLDAAVFCLVVFMICSIINYINNEYAVSRLSREDESLCRIKANERKEYQKSYVRPIKWLAVISSVVSAASPFINTLTTLKVPDTDKKYKSFEYIIVNIASSYWFIDLCVTVVLAILIARAFSVLKDRTENALMLE